MTSSSSSSFLLTASPPSTSLLRRRSSKLHNRFPLLFSNSSRTQVSIETSEADKLVDKIDFGELCNDFECTSSSQVESTARQLARDILELREGNRAFACHAVSVRYKDPIRSFTGREKYKRPMWITSALENPSVVKSLGTYPLHPLLLKPISGHPGASLLLLNPQKTCSMSPKT